MLSNQINSGANFESVEGRPSDLQVQSALQSLMEVYEGKVFSAFDRRTCSEQALRDFRGLLRKRLLKNDQPPPTVDEVDGIKELVLDFLHYHPDRPVLRYGAGQF